MNKSNSNDIVSSKQGTSNLSRAKFGPGMLLKHEDMELLNTYTRDLSRLMFRSLFGCGVVCGLVVDTTRECDRLDVTVESGVAITCSGDPIWVPGKVTLPAFSECGDKYDVLWVVLCRTAKCCAPRQATCSSGDDELPSVCTREQFGYEIRVMSQRPKCVCDCLAKEETDRDAAATAPDELQAMTLAEQCLCADPKLPCYEDHYEGKCKCSCSQCAECDCECVLLARLDRNPDKPSGWGRDHRVRRFVRPVLMRDPQPQYDNDDDDDSLRDDAAAAYAMAPDPEKSMTPPSAKRAPAKTASTKGGKRSTTKFGLPK